MSSGWNTANPPAKASQFSQDQFEEWQKQQNRSISERGASPNDAAKEEEHNRFMLRQCLNAYTCYRELDAYTSCLEANHLIARSDANGTVEVNTKNHVNEKLCRPTFAAYTSCMRSQPNQEAILYSASIEPHCTDTRYELYQCMEANKEVESKTNVAQCEGTYRHLMRCGLNHLWNRYWRSLTKFSDADEYHLYEVSRDENKRQHYLRVVNSTPEELQTYRDERDAAERGYFLNPEQRATDPLRGRPAS